MRPEQTIYLFFQRPGSFFFDREQGAGIELFSYLIDDRVFALGLAFRNGNNPASIRRDSRRSGARQCE